MNRLQLMGVLAVGVLVGTMLPGGANAEDSENKSTAEPVVQQTNAPQSNTEQVPAASAEAVKKEKREKKEETTDTPETFVPSEDISEDLSVSYPVDI